MHRLIIVSFLSEVPLAFYVNLVKIRAAVNDCLVISFYVLLQNVGGIAAFGILKDLVKRLLRIKYQILEVNG